jgi:hypothetical protein
MRLNYYTPPAMSVIFKEKSTGLLYEACAVDQNNELIGGYAIFLDIKLPFRIFAM